MAEDFVQNSINQAASNSRTLTNNNVPQNNDNNTNNDNDNDNNTTVQALRDIKSLLQSLLKDSEANTKANQKQEKALNQFKLSTLFNNLSNIANSLPSGTGKDVKVTNVLDTVSNIVTNFNAVAGTMMKVANTVLKVADAFERTQVQMNMNYMQAVQFSNFNKENARKLSVNFTEYAFKHGLSASFEEDFYKNTAQYINLKTLSPQGIKNVIGLEGTLAKATPVYGNTYSDIARTLYSKQGYDYTQTMAQMSLYKDRFETSSLGLDKSLQLSKQLYDTNRRYNSSMNEAVGTIAKFNKELYNGTLTLQDITTMKSSLQAGSTSDLAAKFQTIMNLGFGTDAMKKAMGDPFMMAALMRNASPETQNAMAKSAVSLAKQGGYTGQALEERVRYFMQSLFNIDLAPELVKKAARGKSITTDIVESTKLTEEEKKRNAEKQAEIEKQAQEEIAATRTYHSNVTTSLDKIGFKLGNILDEMKKGEFEKAGEFTGDLLYDVLHNPKVKAFSSSFSSNFVTAISDPAGYYGDLIKALYNMYTKKDLE